MCPEAEGNDATLVGLVNGRKLFRKLCLGDVWPRRVENVHDELAAAEEPVGDEFAGADSDWCCCVGLQRRNKVYSQLYAQTVIRPAVCIQSTNLPSDAFPLESTKLTALRVS